jgi:hypothetical protein
VITDHEDKGVIKNKALFRTTGQIVVNSIDETEAYNGRVGIGLMEILDTFIVG